MIPLYEVPRVVRFIETRSKMVVARGREKREMGSCYLMGTEFDRDDDKALEIVGGDGCTTM